MVLDQRFTWTPNENTDKLVEKFFTRFEKRGVHRESMGIVFLYDYFCDSYNYWTNSGRELKNIPITWIIGEPQLYRWDNKCEEYKYSYTEGFLSKTKVPTLNELRSRLNITQRELVCTSEELDRQRFYNTSEGFLNCILTTSLYHSESKWCNACKFKEDCIEELKIRDRSTALRRGVLKFSNNG